MNDKVIVRENVVDKIYVIRNQKVMLDRDLAALYDVETKRLKEAVRRNISRFPQDFMFELSKDEFNKLEDAICVLQFRQTRAEIFPRWPLQNTAS